MKMNSSAIALRSVREEHTFICVKIKNRWRLPLCLHGMVLGHFSINQIFCSVSCLKACRLLYHWSCPDCLFQLAVERRMEGPLTSPLLSDEFLCLCFLRYAKLIVLLGEYPGRTFSSCETLLQLLGWAERYVLSLN